MPKPTKGCGGGGTLTLKHYVYSHNLKKGMLIVGTKTMHVHHFVITLHNGKAEYISCMSGVFHHIHVAN
jgi:hypothetical protein